jgi:hypothetical protein
LLGHRLPERFGDDLVEPNALFWNTLELTLLDIEGTEGADGCPGPGPIPRGEEKQVGRLGIAQWGVGGDSTRREISSGLSP